MAYIVMLKYSKTLNQRMNGLKYLANGNLTVTKLQVLDVLVNGNFNAAPSFSEQRNRIQTAKNLLVDKDKRPTLTTEELETKIYKQLLLNPCGFLFVRELDGLTNDYFVSRNTYKSGGSDISEYTIEEKGIRTYLDANAGYLGVGKGFIASPGLGLIQKKP